MSTKIIAEIAVDIKGHHFYQYNYQLGEEITFERDVNNAFSNHAVSVKSLDGKMVGHLPEILARKISPLLRDGFISKMEGRVTSDAKSSNIGTWTKGGGVVLPARRIIFGEKKHAKFIKNNLRK